MTGEKRTADCVTEVASKKQKLEEATILLILFDENGMVYPQEVEFKNAEECTRFYEACETAERMDLVDVCNELNNAYNSSIERHKKYANKVLNECEWVIRPVRVTMLSSPENLFMGKGVYAYTIVTADFYSGLCL